ncbi:MAG TPA: carboxy terminal-processing peptidase, partial [Kofleriaceae bacterium]|nr:carboxy terminal-processing peptidase [Kofleriaceae bacterium]
SASASPAPAPDLPSTPADPREPLLAGGVAYMLENQHLRSHPIDDQLSRAVFAEYLERLDPAKLFLRADHVKKLRYYEDKIDDQLSERSLELARIGSALLAERRAAMAKVVADLLSRPLDFTVEETVESDPDKLSFAATDAELTDRWRKQLKLQVLERIDRMEQDKKNTLSFAEREAKAREELAASWSGRFSRWSKVTPLEPAELFLNALASLYDPHTAYLAPSDEENFNIAMSGQLEGIGAVLREDDHYISVQEIIPGGASWRQGKLQVGDLILAVAQDGEAPVDVTDMRIDQAVKMIRGPKGTVVRLTTKKPDGRVETIAITRDVVVVEESYARGAILGKGKRAMGYIHLPSFYDDISGNARKTARNATDDVRALLAEFRRRKLPGVILDLRNNGGGLLSHAGSITGLFIDSGPVVQTRYSDGRSEVVSDDDPGVAYDGELVILTNRFSASASEILAGALQDYGRAVVVGTGPTHGKGTVQALVDLDRLRNQGGDPLGVLKLTVQQFFGVDGDSTQWRGVEPDISLPDPVSHLEAGERYLDHAIPWSEVDALAYTPWSRRSWKLDELAARSAARVGKQPAFGKLKALGAYLEARRKQTVVPLEKQAWSLNRQRERAELEALSPKLDDGPARIEVVVLDSSGKVATGEAAKRLETWRKEIARDPWLEESLHILRDMVAAR